MIHAQNTLTKMLIAAQAKTAAATASAAWDTLGGDYATIIINFASEVNTSAVGPTISLLHSDDTVVSNHVTIVANRTDEDLVGNRVLVYGVDLKAKKRYLRLTVTTATHTTNDVITLSAVGVLSRLGEGPGSTTEMVATTNDAAVLVS